MLSAKPDARSWTPSLRISAHSRCSNGRGAGEQVAAQAVAEPGDPVGIDLGAGQRVIDDRGDHGFPVRAHHQLLQMQRAALAGAVEGQHVVAAAQRGDGEHEVALLAGRVIPAGVDDGGPGRTGVIHQEQIARQGGVLIRNGHRLGWVVEQRARGGEGVDLGGVERRDFGVVGGVVEHKGRRVAVVVRRPQQVFPRGDPVPGGKGPLAQFGHPRRGGRPCPVPAGLVTIGDPGSGGQHLAEVGPEIVGEPGGP